MNKMTDKLEKVEWDVIVIGTGMGGATLGYALAKAGKRVLFCEKGKSHLNGNSLKGYYAENFLTRPENSRLKESEIMSRAGRWCDEIEDISSSRNHVFIPFIGSGTGGSTALYGMALERFYTSDFVPRQNYPDAKETTLPEKWPVSYNELKPYYEAAEKLFRVRGTGDPLKENEFFDHLLPLPSITPTAKELYDFFCSKGLHPYRLPLACEFVSGCECCQGYLCNKNCKNDSSKVCLEPALIEFGAILLDECKVLKLDATRNEVTGVTCYWRGRELTLQGAIIVLAANALETPRILLNSASKIWTKGLANDSGLVGRNLMRHFVDLYVIRPKTKQEFSVSLKELAFNDFYFSGGQKFGTVQSFGSLPSANVLVEGIEKELRKGLLPLAGSVFKLFKPFVNFLLDRFFSKRIILASIMEDLPYIDNFVALSNKTDYLGRRNIVLKYQIREYDRKRIEAFRRKLSKILKPYRVILLKQAEKNERVAHACGTCRFGIDPKKSVLDKYNRAHEFSNLYVIDSSFFPSSGGTNPALTIAANALRVADHINNR
jgi:choline dehydrogenase-like flavoprotein